MSSAWMISRGSYSDYGVYAVFLDRDEAEAYVTRWNEDYDLQGDSAYCVEEVALRPKLPEPGSYCYSVYITRKGDIVSCSKSEYSARSPDTVVINHGYAGPGWNVGCFARDADHAKKIAGEYRQAELAKEAAGAVAHPCVGIGLGAVPSNSPAKDGSNG